MLVQKFSPLVGFGVVLLVVLRTEAFRLQHQPIGRIAHSVICLAEPGDRERTMPLTDLGGRRPQRVLDVADRLEQRLRFRQLAELYM
jgi:hypothetical protein